MIFDRVFYDTKNIVLAIDKDDNKIFLTDPIILNKMTRDTDFKIYGFKIIFDPILLKTKDPKIIDLLNNHFYMSFELNKNKNNIFLKYLKDSNINILKTTYERSSRKIIY